MSACCSTTHRYRHHSFAMHGRWLLTEYLYKPLESVIKMQAQQGLKWANPEC